jgi:hypothetical protein
VVLSNDLAQVSTQCNRAQSVNEATLRKIEGKSQKSEAAAQKALNSLRGKVEALTEKHLKARKEINLVKKAQDLRIKDLDEALSQSLHLLSHRAFLSIWPASWSLQTP